MQKLSVELNSISDRTQNAPGDTSPVPCSVNKALNREETLSVPCIVLTDNNSEENLLQTTGGLKTDMLSHGGDKCPPLHLTEDAILFFGKSKGFIA